MRIVKKRIFNEQTRLFVAWISIQETTRYSVSVAVRNDTTFAAVMEPHGGLQGETPGVVAAVGACLAGATECGTAADEWQCLQPVQWCVGACLAGATECGTAAGEWQCLQPVQWCVVARRGEVRCQSPVDDCGFMVWAR